MADLAQRIAWRDAPTAVRYPGARTVEYDGKRVTYATDGEMAAALPDLERRITAAGTTGAVSPVSHHRMGSESKNLLQNGDTVRVTTPARGIVVGSLLGVAAFTAGEGDPVEIAATGVYERPKDRTTVTALGDRVAWDATGKRIDLPGTRLYPLSIATEAAGNGVTTVKVRLDGVATQAA